MDITTSLSTTELKEKISTLSSMLSSVDDVTEKVNTVLNDKRKSSMTCQSFVGLVSSFESIADDTQSLENITTLAANITKNTVETCSVSDKSKLEELSSSLSNISASLTSRIEALYLLLLSTPLPQSSTPTVGTTMIGVTKDITRNTTEITVQTLTKDTQTTRVESIPSSRTTGMTTSLLTNDYTMIGRTKITLLPTINNTTIRRTTIISLPTSNHTMIEKTPKTSLSTINQIMIEKTVVNSLPTINHTTIEKTKTLIGRTTKSSLPAIHQTMTESTTITSLTTFEQTIIGRTKISSLQNLNNTMKGRTSTMKGRTTISSLLQSINHTMIGRTTISSLQSINHTEIGRTTLSSLPTINHTMIGRTKIYHQPSNNHTIIERTTLSPLPTINHTMIGRTTITYLPTMNHTLIRRTTIPSLPSSDHTLIERTTIYPLLTINHTMIGRKTISSLPTIKHTMIKRTTKSSLPTINHTIMIGITTITSLASFDHTMIERTTISSLPNINQTMLRKTTITSLPSIDHTMIGGTTISSLPTIKQTMIGRTTTYMFENPTTKEASLKMSSNILTRPGTQKWTELKGKSTFKANQQSVTRNIDFTAYTQSLIKTNITYKVQTSYLGTTIQDIDTTIINKESTMIMKTGKNSFASDVSSSHSKPFEIVSSITSTTYYLQTTTLSDSLSEIPYKLTTARVTNLQPTRYWELTNISIGNNKPSSIYNSSLLITKTSSSKTGITKKISSELSKTYFLSSQLQTGRKSTNLLSSSLYFTSKLSSSIFLTKYSATQLPSTIIFSPTIRKTKMSSSFVRTAIPVVTKNIIGNTTQYTVQMLTQDKQRMESTQLSTATRLSTTTSLPTIIITLIGKTTIRSLPVINYTLIGGTTITISSIPTLKYNMIGKTTLRISQKSTTKNASFKISAKIKTEQGKSTNTIKYTLQSMTQNKQSIRENSIQSSMTTRLTTMRSLSTIDYTRRGKSTSHETTNIVTKQGTQTWTVVKGKSTHGEKQQSVTNLEYITNTQSVMKTNIANDSISSILVNVSTAQTSYLTTRIVSIGGTHVSIANKGNTGNAEKTEVSSSQSKPFKIKTSITSTTSQIRKTTFSDALSEVPHILTNSRISSLKQTNISTAYINLHKTFSAQLKATNSSQSQLPSSKQSSTKILITNKFSLKLQTTDIFSSQSPKGKNHSSLPFFTSEISSSELSLTQLPTSLMTFSKLKATTLSASNNQTSDVPLSSLPTTSMSILSSSHLLTTKIYSIKISTTLTTSTNNLSTNTGDVSTFNISLKTASKQYEATSTKISQTFSPTSHVSEGQSDILTTRWNTILQERTTEETLPGISESTLSTISTNKLSSTIRMLERTIKTIKQSSSVRTVGTTLMFRTNTSYASEIPFKLSHTNLKVTIDNDFESQTARVSIPGRSSKASTLTSRMSKKISETSSLSTSEMIPLPSLGSALSSSALTPTIPSTILTSPNIHESKQASSSYSYHLKSTFAKHSIILKGMNRTLLL